jgi:hypothetical protein
LFARLGEKRLNRKNTTMMMMKIDKSGKSSNGLNVIALNSNLHALKTSARTTDDSLPAAESPIINSVALKNWV